MKSTLKAPTPIRPTTRTTESSIDFQQKIRLRAYDLYEQRGSEHGRDLDDWLQAESELTQQKAKVVAA
jgi:hypothetical protein